MNYTLDIPNYRKRTQQQQYSIFVKRGKEVA